MVVSLYSRKELTFEFSYSQKAVSAITKRPAGQMTAKLEAATDVVTTTRGRSPSKLLDKLESRSGHSAQKYAKKCNSGK